MQQRHHIQCSRQVFCYMPIKYTLFSTGNFGFQARLTPKSNGQLVSIPEAAHIPERRETKQIYLHSGSLEKWQKGMENPNKRSCFVDHFSFVYIFRICTPVHHG